MLDPNAMGAPVRLAVLLLTRSTAGRGNGGPIDEAMGEAVDADSFLFDQLGVQTFSR